MEPPRPLTKRLRKKIRNYILTVSYRDRIRAETVSRCNRRDIEASFRTELEGVTVGNLPDILRGEVLIDSKGRGSFQQ